MPIIKNIITTMTGCFCAKNNHPVEELNSNTNSILLPEEILQQILKNLPVFQLIKCRLVAKKWSNLSEFILKKKLLKIDLTISFLCNQIINFRIEDNQKDTFNQIKLLDFDKIEHNFQLHIKENEFKIDENFVSFTAQFKNRQQENLSKVMDVVTKKASELESRDMTQEEKEQITKYLASIRQVMDKIPNHAFPPIKKINRQIQAVIKNTTHSIETRMQAKAFTYVTGRMFNFG